MEVSKEIIEVLDYLGDKLGIAVDWTDKNVLPYVQQLCEKFIKWDIATSVFWIVVGIVLAIGGCLFIKLYKICENKYNEVEGEWGFVATLCMAACIFLLISSILVIGFNIYDIIKDMFIPELRLYEYMKDLCK